MRHWLLVLMSWTVLLVPPAQARGLPSIPFVDGRWKGDIDRAPGSLEFRACWASTAFADGTTLRLERSADGSWRIELSNPGWRLQPGHHYVMVSLVDFYPRLRFDAVAMSRMQLEIANIGRISLLEQIENGHTMDLDADGFHEKYDLEGSAKIIARIRTCFADHQAAQ